MSNIDRTVGMISFGFSAAIFAVFAALSEEWIPDRLVALIACILGVCAFVRTLNRPSVRRSGRVVLIAGLLKTLRVDGDDVERWYVDEQIIGAFRRATLGLQYVDGRQHSMRLIGIYAARGGRMEARLRRVAAELPTANGVERP